MAYPVPMATNGGDSAGQVTNHTIKLPAGCNVAGRKIVLALMTRANGENPGGLGSWSIKRQLGLATSGVATVAEYTTTGSEGWVGDGTDTITATTSVSCGSAHFTALFGSDANSIEYGTLATSASSATHDPPSLSPSYGSKETLWLAIALIAHGQSASFGYPTGYTDTNLTRWNNSSGAMVMRGMRNATTATEDPNAFTLSAARIGTALVIAVEPVGGSTVDLTGTAAGTSSMSGSITTGTEEDLAGTAAGTSAMTGEVDLDIYQTQTLAGTSSMSGTISLGTTVDLTGTAAGTSAMSGAVEVDQAIAGTAAGTSAMSGAVTTDGTQELTGTAAGSSTMVAVLTMDALITGTAAGSSSMVGSITFTELQPSFVATPGRRLLVGTPIRRA